jgi:hypothetical protein
MMAALGLLATLATPALAAPGVPEGAPDLDLPGIPGGYYVWHDEGGWHLRTTDAELVHEYTGQLSSNGQFEDVDLARPENDDSFAVRQGGNAVDFRFRTYTGIDGLNFRLAGGDYLTFRLYRDGHLISTSHIYLGATREHPRTNPFTLRW